jgi:signal transduction histidine kinase
MAASSVFGASRSPQAAGPSVLRSPYLHVAVVDTLELALHLAKAGFLAGTLGLFGRGEALAFLDVALEEPFNRPRICQLGFQSREDAALDIVQIKGPAVSAGAALAHPGAVDTPPLGVAVLRHQSAAATAAAQQARRAFSTDVEHDLAEPLAALEELMATW